MNDPSARFPIGAVAKLTGLTVDALRVWERRYGVVTPSRDERGRMYSEADVRRLQMLAAAVSRGHAIGRIARLPEEEIQALLSTLPASAPARSAPSGSAPVDGLLAALRAYDSGALDRELGRLALALPPRELVHRAVLPVMRVVGEEWHAGRMTAGQEHMLSAALRSLLGSMTRLATSDRATRRLLFVTPAGERHEFGILAAAMLTAIEGLGVIYLGPDLPAPQIVDVATHTGADIVVMGLVYGGDTGAWLSEVRILAANLPPAVEIWLGGQVPAVADALPVRAGLLVLPDFQVLESHLARIARGVQ